MIEINQSTHYNKYNWQSASLHIPILQFSEHDRKVNRFTFVKKKKNFFMQFSMHLLLLEVVTTHFRRLGTGIWYILYSVFTSIKLLQKRSGFGTEIIVEATHEILQLCTPRNVA